MRLVSRALFLSVAPTTIHAGSAGAVRQSYPATTSMSTLARFPWVWTAVRAVAGDLAGLPLVARSGGEAVDDAVLALFDAPNPGTTGYLFRKQIAADYLCTGNWYAWLIGGALYRLHPAWVAPIPGPMGIPVGYELTLADGRAKILEPAEVLHGRDISWSDGPEAIVGESAMRCLHDDLMLELGSKSLAAEQSAKGKPDIIMSIKGASGPAIIEKLKDRWDTSVSNHDGAFIVGDGVEVETVGWSPEQMQFSEGRGWTRDAILAVMEVPPARAGLASANYGTQRQQMKTYAESLKRRAKAFDDSFSTLARPGVRIEHDFSDVEALQVSYTERLMRVATWVGLGSTPEDAAKYEGFVNAPVGASVEDFRSPRPVDRPAEEPQDRAVPLASLVYAYLTESRGRYQALAVDLSAGVELGLVQRWEAERLFGVLDGAGVSPDSARWFAEEITAATLESVRMIVGLAADGDELADLGLEHVDAFSHGRAVRLAGRIKLATKAA